MSFLVTLKRWFGLSSGPLELKPGDKLLVCEDCNSQFVFDAGEQAFFKEKGFTEPKRCPTCRKKVRRRMRRRGRGGRPQQENNQQSHQPSQNNNNNNNKRHRNDHHRRHRRPSGIDGDSPYADER